MAVLAVTRGWREALRSAFDKVIQTEWRCPILSGVGLPQDSYAMPHPYTTTVHGLDTLIDQLRSVFPAKLTPETLRTWKIGRSNESSLLGTLRFLGVIEEHRSTLPQAREVFTASTDGEFAEGFAKLVKEAYRELFEAFGDATWTLSRDELISFMRAADHSSTRVGDQQAVTFQALARHAGRGTIPYRSMPSGRRRHSRTGADRVSRGSDRDFFRGQGLLEPLPRGLTVRPREDADGMSNGYNIAVTINLPITDDPSVYDEIFRSMRKHLFAE